MVVTARKLTIFKQLSGYTFNASDFGYSIVIKVGMVWK
jgi:hypothetical protein